MEKEKIKAMIVFGELVLRPANRRYFSGVKFLLASPTIFSHPDTRADVAAASLPMESSGSMTSCDRRLQKTVSKKRNRKLADHQFPGREDANAAPLPFGRRDFQRNHEGQSPLSGCFLRVILGSRPAEGKNPTSSGKANFGPIEIEISPRDREKQTLLASGKTYHQTTKIKGKVAPTRTAAPPTGIRKVRRLPKG